jgi:hypothetical protein
VCWYRCQNGVFFLEKQKKIILPTIYFTIGMHDLLFDALTWALCGEEVAAHPEVGTYWYKTGIQLIDYIDEFLILIWQYLYNIS